MFDLIKKIFSKPSRAAYLEEWPGPPAQCKHDNYKILEDKTLESLINIEYNKLLGQGINTEALNKVVSWLLNKVEMSASRLAVYINRLLADYPENEPKKFLKIGYFVCPDCNEVTDLKLLVAKEIAMIVDSCFGKEIDSYIDKQKAQRLLDDYKSGKTCCVDGSHGSQKHP